MEGPPAPDRPSGLGSPSLPRTDSVRVGSHPTQGVADPAQAQHGHPAVSPSSRKCLHHRDGAVGSVWSQGRWSGNTQLTTVSSAGSVVPGWAECPGGSQPSWGVPVPRVGVTWAGLRCPSVNEMVGLQLPRPGARVGAGGTPALPLGLSRPLRPPVSALRGWGLSCLCCLPMGLQGCWAGTSFPSPASVPSDGVSGLCPSSPPCGLPLEPLGLSGHAPPGTHTLCDSHCLWEDAGPLSQPLLSPPAFGVPRTALFPQTAFHFLRLCTGCSPASSEL